MWYYIRVSNKTTKELTIMSTEQEYLDRAVRHRLISIIGRNLELIKDNAIEFKAMLNHKDRQGTLNLTNAQLEAVLQAVETLRETQLEQRKLIGD